MDIYKNVSIYSTYIIYIIYIYIYIYIYASIGIACLIYLKNEIKLVSALTEISHK